VTSAPSFPPNIAGVIDLLGRARARRLARELAGPVNPSPSEGPVALSFASTTGPAPHAPVGSRAASRPSSSMARSRSRVREVAEESARALIEAVAVSSVREQLDAQRSR